MHPTNIKVQTPEINMEFNLELDMIFGHTPSAPEKKRPEPDSETGTKTGIKKESAISATSASLITNVHYLKPFSNTEPKVLTPYQATFRDLDAKLMVQFILNTSKAIKDDNLIKSCLNAVLKSYETVFKNTSFGSRVSNHMFPVQYKNNSTQSPALLTLSITQYR